MRCKNCGGELIFKGDTTVCESCGAVSKVESIFENTEVFICYIETDDSGRRTKDSIVAQEVYGKLEQNKINAFYGKP